MPSRALRLDRRTVYLDHSTLCNAFRAHSTGSSTPSPAAYLPLREWIGHVAKEANLCFSSSHIAELAGWGDTQAATSMARWYERLPVVWVGSFASVADDEAAYWTLVAAGQPPPAPFNPFVRSFYDAFRSMTFAASRDLLRAKSPILALVAAFRIEARQRAEKSLTPREFGAIAAERFRRDTAEVVKQGWDEDQMTEQLDANRELLLRRTAEQMQRRLLDRGELAGDVTVMDLADRLVALMDARPDAMPCFRVQHDLTRGLRAAALARGAPSKKEQRALSGTFFDSAHAASAAYCDVFTCDGATSSWLGNVRESSGLSRQLCISECGGDEAFVRELMSRWP